MARSTVLVLTKERVVGGRELNYFLSKAPRSGKRPDLWSVTIELEDWLGAQG